MNWIKAKIKRLWKWFAGLFVVGATVLTISGFPPILQGCDLVKSEFEKMGSINKVLEQKGSLEGFENLTRGTVSGCAVADKVKTVQRVNVKFSGADYDIEILDTKAIDGGVEIFARAWDSQGQIGFGIDGTVDIERFIISRPPILVPDQNGTVVRTWEERDPATNAFVAVRTLKFTENIQLATLQNLAHIIKVSTKNNPKNKIKPGKIGNTTSTFYPDPDAESTSVDGRAGNFGETHTWTQKRSAAGNGSTDLATTAELWLLEDGAGDKWDRMVRVIMGFDSSAIPDTDTVSSATLSFVISATNFADNHNQGIAIARRQPASATAIADSDYDIGGWTMTAQATAIDFGSLAHDTVTYNDFTLNATGIGNVSKTGVSWYGPLFSGDIDNSAPTWIDGTKGTRADILTADTALTTLDPKLVVVHAGAAAAPGDSLWDDNF